MHRAMPPPPKKGITIVLPPRVQIRGLPPMFTLGAESPLNTRDFVCGTKEMGTGIPPSYWPYLHPKRDKPVFLAPAGAERGFAPNWLQEMGGGQ